ncbi:TRAP-type C4-dicarboxylate transport system, small permease component [Tistlia consotensis]|uniref:TRAP transporter small permease protein n=1 Tax=Tistlia consotensis USBA 355 TaxID=560819 RepID=A0A1Y6BY57_9PROT|nr:TRAP transporter small permease [Tistlia consotensis]SMF35574.1 TRAP-type C4-dicarboxylate transport system, small permease component [Tistlia consotensis USBA 355]SNR70957.1 TRAP-type C4-dicarboxylate transport system, small permease component [Tistlia consotensis]
MRGNPILWLSDRLVEIAGLVLLAMMLHVCADVAMKYLFNDPIEGTLEVVSYYYMVGSVFLPIALVELRRGSVAVDLFFNMMPARLKLVCVGAVLLASALVYGGLADVTWHDALKAFAKREVVMGPIDVVIWPSRFALPASFALGALVCLWHLGRLLFGGAAARAELISTHEELEEV